MEQAQTLAASAPLRLTTIKRFVNQHVLPKKSPAEAMSETIRQLNVVRDSVDIKEGVAAFREAPRRSTPGAGARRRRSRTGGRAGPSVCLQVRAAPPDSGSVRGIFFDGDLLPDGQIVTHAPGQIGR